MQSDVNIDTDERALGSVMLPISDILQTCKLKMISASDASKAISDTKAKTYSHCCTLTFMRIILYFLRLADFIGECRIPTFVVIAASSTAIEA